VLWVALTLAMLYVFVRDLDHVFEMAMRLMFFITPIVYRVDSLSPTLRTVALLNPVAVVIENIRTIVIGGRVPPIEYLLLPLAGHFALCYAALVTFRRAEPALLERL
jgi:lipopolysaccharide transport system permease protein